MFILTFVCYFMQKIAMKAELERKGMPLKRGKNLLQIYLFFYRAVLSAESWFVIFFIDIHHLAKAIKPNRSLQSLLRVVILIAIVFMSQFYIDFQRTRYVLKIFPHCVS